MVSKETLYISISERKSGVEEEVTEESVNKVKDAFCNVKDRDEVGAIILNEAQKIASRTALFLIRNARIIGWKGKGLNVDGFELPEEEISIFSEVLQTRNYYRGPVLRIKGNESFIKMLGGTPKDSLLMPVNIRDRVVLIL